MKHFVPVVAAFVIAAAVSQAQPVANISLIHHNIHSGGQAAAAADHIEDLLAMTPQKALVLIRTMPASISVSLILTGNTSGRVHPLKGRATRHLPAPPRRRSCPHGAWKWTSPGPTMGTTETRGFTPW